MAGESLLRFVYLPSRLNRLALPLAYRNPVNLEFSILALGAATPTSSPAEAAPTSGPTTPKVPQSIVRILNTPHLLPFAILQRGIQFGFEEGTTGIIKLQETEEVVFKIFLTWLYAQSLWSKDVKESWPDLGHLISLYIFADMARIPRLNHIIDALIAISDSNSELPSSRELAFGWENTSASSPLCSLIVDWFTLKPPDGYSDGGISRLPVECPMEIMKAIQPMI
ncbi:uncharacterized protein RSE6_06539 [Rhynchosporium secalis]|uniref:BTB domain-containing protein n=1 Tax=Rhynchosporium secalis TaxID=38038 RepID=A0A1E1MAN0_RHYSE|nr:uncharacterized protein RSE6_06539 [Rhynchosporium secalis]